MTGFSHATTGAAIALTFHNPAVAVPVALMSHFVLDAMPHYGSDSLDGTDKNFRRFIIADAIAGVTMIGLLTFLIPERWPLIILCAIFATIPDLMWLPNHVRQTRNQQPKPHNRIMRWHQGIQFEDSRWGGIIGEAAWVLGIGAFLLFALI